MNYLYIILLISILIKVVRYFSKKKSFFCNKISTKEEIIKHLDSNIFEYPSIIDHNMKYKLDDPKWVKYIDKIKFKEYARSLDIPTFKSLAIYDQKDYKNINYEKLPNSFIIKSNKGSGNNIVVEDRKKMNYSKNIKDISTWASLYRKNQPQYEYIIPKIIIEEYIENLLEDIKIWFHNGKISMIQITVNHNKRNFYDLHGKLLPITMDYDNDYSNKLVENIFRDRKWEEMLNVARKLASGVKLNLFRVDIYYINKKFYGGEITLSPDGGYIKNIQILKP